MGGNWCRLSGYCNNCSLPSPLFSTPDITRKLKPERSLAGTSTRKRGLRRRGPPFSLYGYVLAECVDQFCQA